MTIGSLGKALANQAMETTKNTVMDAVRPSDPAKPAETKPLPQDTGAIIIGQIQAMQRPLREDQELIVRFRAGNEMLRIKAIFVPTAQVVCKVLRVAAGASPVRVNVRTPKPPPKPAA